MTGADGGIAVALRIGLVIAGLLVYSLVLARVFDRRALRFLSGLPWARRRSLAELDAVGNVVVGFLGQAAVVLALATTLGLDLAPSFQAGLAPGPLFAGVALGLAETGVGFQLGLLVASSWGLRRDGAEVSRGGSGWVRHFLRLRRALPGALWMPLVVGYIALEEALFRGIAVGVLRPLSPAAAAAGSTLLFVLCQVPGMPGLREAVFPMAGAAVIGATHGILAVECGALPPLVAAHATYFLLATRQLGPPRRSPWGSR